MATEVDSGPGALALAKLEHAFSDRLAVAEKPRFEPTQPDAQPGLRRLVLNGLQPFGERLCAVLRLISENFEHGEIVAYKLLTGKGDDFTRPLST